METGADRALPEQGSQSERFADGSSIVRIACLDWVPWASPGVVFKLLSTNRGTGMWSALLKLEPGTDIPPQYRLADAYVSILSGDGTCGDTPLSSGVFHVQQGGRSYIMKAGDQGLVCYILALGGALLGKGSPSQTLVDLDWLSDQAATHDAAAHLSARSGLGR